MKMKKCLDAAVGLSDVDTERYLELYEQYKKTGASDPEARAAKDLQAEIVEERGSFLDAVKRAAGSVAAKIKDYMTMDLFADPVEPTAEPTVNAKPAKLEPVGAQFSLPLDLDDLIESLPEKKQSHIDANSPAYRQLKQSAARMKPAFDGFIDQWAKRFEGEPKLAPIKGDARAIQKINVDYSGDASQLKDMLRATIIVPNAQAATRLFKQLMKQNGAVTQGSRNWFEGESPSEYGYVDAKLNMKFGDVFAEIQISTPALIDVKGQAHELYKQARDVLATEKTGAALSNEDQSLLNKIYADSKALFAVALEANHRSNFSKAPGKEASKEALDMFADPPNTLGKDARLGGSLASDTALSSQGKTTTGTPSTSQNSQRERPDFIDTSDKPSIPLGGQNVQKKRGVSNEIQPDLLAEPAGESAGNSPGFRGQGAATGASGADRRTSDRSDDANEPSAQGSGRDAIYSGNDGKERSDSSSVPSAKPRKLKNYVAPKTEGLNYTINESDEIGVGGLRKKYSDNIAAIKLLKQIESEVRPATADEQKVLARYVGWGGLKNAFFLGDASSVRSGFKDGRESSMVSFYERGQSSEWARERRDLLALLTDEEYEFAKGSTPNAHFTPPKIITAMWNAVSRLGFSQGRVLEPALGAGHFFGLMPTGARAGSTMVGIELDSLTGRIAKQLYQGADIRVQGFEKTNLVDGFFDLAISNVPFGNYKVSDPKFDKYQANIHDYFFLKALSKVREGGLVAFITSDGTMDKLSPKLRQVMAKQAQLVGAIRLPNNAFKENAATEVTTDIIFLKKRGPSDTDKGQNWTEVKPFGEGIKINEYFAKNPEMMVGNMTLSGTMYRGQDQALVLSDPSEFDSLLQKAIDKLPADVFNQTTSEAFVEPQKAFQSDAKLGTLFTKDGKVYVAGTVGSVEVSASAKDAPMVEQANKIREAIRKHFAVQTTDGISDEQFAASLTRLNAAYDVFVKKHGELSSKKFAQVFNGDPDLPLFRSLEKENKAKTGFEKSDVFFKRTVSAPSEVTRVESAIDALNVSLNERGRVDLVHMAKISGMAESQLIGELEQRIFLNPASNAWETSDFYLSGKVREKLREAEAAAQSEPRFRANAEALRAVIPQDIAISDISISLGQSWIPPTVLSDFVVEEFGMGRAAKVSVIHSNVTSDWIVDTGKYGNSSASAANTYGGYGFSPTQLFQMALNLKQPTVWGQTEDGSRFVEQKETAAVREKQDKMKERFAAWVKQDESRAKELAALYNNEFNGFRLPVFDGTHLSLPGTNPLISLRNNVKDGAWRIVSSGKNTLLAHAVGAGKTYTMIVGGMELRRLGLARKPMYVVPNHMLLQFSNEFLQLYPSANVLIASKEDLAKEKRKEFAARTATGDWDAIVITHKSFESLQMTPQAVADHIGGQIAQYEEAILMASAKREDGPSDKRLLKQLEKKKKNLAAKLESALSQSKKDDLVYFEDLGVDQLFVDEAHYFKNLAFVTKMERVAGLATTDSQRSQDMFLKTQYVTNLHQGKRGVVFATGTPIANSLTELYTMQRYLDMDTLESTGLAHFDNWAAMFGQTVTRVEANPTGSGFRTHKRFSKFKNVPELMQLFRRVADIKTAKMLNLPVPALKGGKVGVVTVPASQEQKDFVLELAKRAEAIKNRLVEPSQDNMLKVTGEGRKAALDIRLVDPTAPDRPNSKVNQAVENIYRIFTESKGTRGSQLVFSDLSTPKTDGAFSIYNDVKKKLVAKGVPADQVQFIHDFDTDAKKDKLFADVRSGAVRVLLGSTDKMGAGTNVQKNLIAKHDLDAPWRPADIEQRDGRIIRQGNDNKVVEVIRYVTEGTFDVYSWQTLETKATFIDQVMNGDTSIRELEDNESRALSFAEVKALAMGNPLVLEKVAVESQLAKLSMLESSHQNDQSRLTYDIQNRESELKLQKEWLKNALKDVEKIVQTRGDNFAIKLGGSTITKRQDAADWLQANFPAKQPGQAKPITKDFGSIGGFKLVGSVYPSGLQIVELVGAQNYSAELGDSWSGLVTRIENTMREIDSDVASIVDVIAEKEADVVSLKGMIGKTFDKRAELEKARARLREIDAELALDRDEVEDQDGDTVDSVEQPVGEYNANQAKADQRKAIAESFEAQTGTHIAKAGVILAGIEIRNNMRKNGKNKSAIEPDPFNEKQLALLDAWEKLGSKVSHHLYHTTSVDNLASIAKIGLQPGQKARAEGVSGEGKLYFSPSEKVSNFHSKPGDVMLRLKKGYVLKGDVEIDLLASGGADGSLATNVGVEPEAIEVKSRGKWVPLKDSIESADAVVRQSVDDYLPFGAKQKVHDLFNTQTSFNAWWHKTVGTQYHKAQVSKEFAKVFDETQNFIGDVARFANDAADQAQSILPRLESFKDLKKKPLSKEDEKVLGKVVFDGTLRYTRDAQGKLIDHADVEKSSKGLNAHQKGQELFKRGFISERVHKMWLGLPMERYEKLVNGSYDKNIIGKAGVVFTDAELKAFKLSPQQIIHYREFRAAVDRSLKDLVTTEMMSYDRDLPEDVRRSILSSDSVSDKAQLMRDHFFELAAKNPDRANEYDGLGNQMIELGDRADSLIRRGYAPLMRFGRYSVYVTKGDEQVYFGLFERESAANEAFRTLQQEYPDAQIQQGVLSEEAFKLMSGMTPDTLELFAELTGVERTDAFADFVKMAKNNRSAMKRMLERKGIAGFSGDASRVLASFITSNARAASGNLHHAVMREAAAQIPKELGDVKDEAVKLIDYVQNPIEEAAQIRGLLFVQYIGGSVASAMVNLTQPLTMTVPYLSQFVGPAKAAGLMGAAMKDALKKSQDDAALNKALAKGEKEGIVSPQEIHQLQSEASRNFGNNIHVRRSLYLWGSLFGLAEQYNRRNTFIAAWRVALETKHPNPYEFAKTAIAETQGVYNKANKPNWARGAVGSTLFTFKQFSIHYLEFMKRLPNRERALALAILVAAAGLQGLPFADDLDDILDTIGQGLGYSWNTKQKKAEFAAMILGRDAAEIMLRGLSAMPGMPLDVAGRMGMSNLLPGTGLLLQSKVDKTGEILDVLGPAGGVVRDAIKGQFLPIAVRNAVAGITWGSQGFATDANGRKVMDVSPVEAAAKAVGFNPAVVARESRAVGLAMQNVNLAKNVESSIAQLWAEGRVENNAEKVAKAQEKLRNWNQTNPESRIRITPEQIARRVKEMRQTREQRVIARTPREIRAEVGAILE